MGRYGGLTRDALVTEMFTAGQTYLEIATKLRTSRNAIAGVCRRLNLKRHPDKPPAQRKPRNIAQPKPIISAEEQAERAIDQRDLDILADIEDGHSVRQTAAHWGVSPTFVNRLKQAARAA